MASDDAPPVVSRTDVTSVRGVVFRRRHAQTCGRAGLAISRVHFTAGVFPSMTTFTGSAATATSFARTTPEL